MTNVPSPEAAIESSLRNLGLEFDQPQPGLFVITLPGEHKLKTTLSLQVSDHSISINAFVARRPEENEDLVHRWLLERNRRMSIVAFSIDRLGDIYLVGRLPQSILEQEGLDRILGAVLEYADGSFNTILGLGFPTAIRREWQWRVERGESTANLEAFRALIADGEDPAR
jgi:hypothetical protein